MKKRFWLIYFCILIGQLLPHICFAQTQKIEIQKTLFYKTTTLSQKLKAAISICEQAHSLNIDTLYHYALLAHQLAMEQRDTKKVIIANTFIETWLGRKNLFDSALVMCQADLRKLSYKKDGIIYAKVMQQECYNLMRSNQQKKTLETSYNFLEQAEAAADTTSQIYCDYIIASVYRNMQQYEQALQWLGNAERTARGDAWEETKNEYRIYFLTGQMYNWKFEDENQEQQSYSHDSLLSVKYTDRAIADSRKFENLGILALSLGLKAANSTDRKDVMLNCIMESNSIYRQLNDTISLQNSMFQLCDYYVAKGDPHQAVLLCLKDSGLFRNANSGQQLDFYDKLAESYRLAGNYKEVDSILMREIHFKDSLYATNSAHDLADLNARYEDQKKENTIIRQKLDIASKQNNILIISALSIVLLLVIIFLYQYYRIKQKNQKEKEKLAVAAAEEAERKRISADLHDNIGTYAAAAASTIATIQPLNGHVQDKLLLLKDTMQDMITQLNDSIWALNKKEVQLTGIGDRFKLLVQKLGNAYPGINIFYDEEITHDRTLSSFQALHLFRVLQEGLNNALRHSKCRNINICIRSSLKRMEITISDDGIGMENINVAGNGLNNIKLRAKDSGWFASWVSNRDGGTTIIISTQSHSSNTNLP